MSQSPRRPVTGDGSGGNQSPAQLRSPSPHRRHRSASHCLRTRDASTTGNSHSSVRAKTHRKMRIPSEKYFSDGERSEKYTQKYDVRKIDIFCVFTVRKNIFLCVVHSQKNVTARLNIFLVCVKPHRKKVKTRQKNNFSVVIIPTEL